MKKKIIKKLFILACILLLCNVLLYLKFGKDSINKTSELAANVSDKTTGVGDSLSQQFKDKSELIRSNKVLLNENSNLKAKNKELEAEQAVIKKNETESKTNSDKNKKAIDGAKDSSSYSLVDAQIIRRNTTDWFKEATINVGSKDGIQVGEAILYEGSLFGFVESVDENYSTIKLLTNSNVLINIPAMIISGGKDYNGIITSYDIEENVFNFESYSPQKEMKVYDKVYTNGYQKGVPQGINLGTVTSIDKNDKSKKTIYKVQPINDLINARNVSVVQYED